MREVILRMENITKEFPGVKALDNVNLNVYKGKVMALLGENGAGKSTLMKILSGVYKKTSGELYYNNAPLEVANPKDAMQKGIAIIHQELNLIEEMSVAENIFMGRYPSSGGRISWKNLHDESKRLLDKLGMEINPKTKVGSLSIGQKQMVEIAKALSFDAQIIIMDEPTDALTDSEAESLFKVIKELVGEGKSVVYISHRLPEIFQICDDITILRDGQFIDEMPVSEMDETILIEKMVGRKLEEQYPYIAPLSDETLMEVKNIKNEFVSDISFVVKKGEILGVAGLMGAGRTELAKSIYGSIKCEIKDIILDGVKFEAKNEKQALSQGIVYVSEDRKKEGLVLGMSVAKNVTISSLGRFSKGQLINKKQEKESVLHYKDAMRIKTPSLDQSVKLLSGGNQQKVSIAKSLSTQPKILIMDEPTRGVDVGAKKEIYELMNEFKRNGLGILMISSEIPELLGVCDRIMVMSEGKIAGVLSRDKANSNEIMRLAIGAGV
ncbi:sugar ABC transporter ATP-binding protein [Acetoanaerobium noterae]|uniref:sugar ABC transporter ATP-binding protein n=1 Tax=Acetoanaerobium noterae TaxID=745369 RepID=UPI0028A5EF12|nr:ATP-binding cassette domain-containing protein [Acetoanaerobium noterae]